MNRSLPKVLIVLLGLLLVGNLAYLDYLIFFKKVSKEKDISLPVVLEQGDSLSGQKVVSQPVSACGPACQARITEEVAQAVATISGETKETVVQKIIEKTVQPTPAPQTLYLALGSGASTTSTSWSDVGGSEFVFDLADYRSGSQTKVYWQVNQKAEHANSRCFARIYDVTNNRAVDFSEQTTDQTSFQNHTSSQLSIWWGKNNHRLQIKSLNGITCFLEAPRLIIISR
jgi:hypothetical protein